MSKFRTNQRVVWEGIDPSFTFVENECVLFLGEIKQVPGHCIVVKQNGKVILGFHTDNFREPTKDEI
jgi:hypothetical protein